MQPVPDYDQDAEHVTEILVNNTNNRTKSILKNQGSQTTAPQSPPKDHPVNLIRAGTLRFPTMNVAPDCHQHENLSGRSTTEVVDLAQPTINTETIISKPQTKRTKRSLLLELPSQISQSENEVEDPRPITTNMQSETSSSVANDTPQQDESWSYPADQTTEYPSQNHIDRGKLAPHSSHTRQSGNEAENPPPITIAANNMQSEFPSGFVNDTPTQDEPQSYPMAQIAEYLTKDPVTEEECIPIFSAVTLKKKKKMLFAPMDFQDLTLDGLIDPGLYIVNCISETDHNKIPQMSPKDLGKELEPTPSNSTSQMATSKPPSRR